MNFHVCLFVGWLLRCERPRNTSVQVKLTVGDEPGSVSRQWQETISAAAIRREFKAALLKVDFVAEWLERFLEFRGPFGGDRHDARDSVAANRDRGTFMLRLGSRIREDAIEIGDIAKRWGGTIVPPRR